MFPYVSCRTFVTITIQELFRGMYDVQGNHLRAAVPLSVCCLLDIIMHFYRYPTVESLEEGDGIS